MLRFFRSTALWILLLPYAIAFLGAASNQLVLFVNHDRFPVAANLVKINRMGIVATSNDGVGMLDDTHCVMTSKTHLNVLADIIDLHDGIYSIGDMLIELGDWLSTFSLFCWICVVVPRLRQP